MAATLIDEGMLRVALDSALGVWAAIEIALRMANRDAERGTDWTFVVVVGSVIAAINLGFRAAHAITYSLGAPAIFGAIGLALVIVGAGLRLWAMLTLGRLFTFVVSIQGDHVLVDRGPYRMLRHPSYTGGLIGLVGAGVALDNAVSIVVLLVLPLAGVLIRIPFEESSLRAGLGGSYDDYASRTWRLVPHLW